MMLNPVQSRQHRQRGVALLEVLIAFFVLSVGLLGLAGLQMKALQFNQSAYQQSQATISIYDMLDRMRMNRDEVGDGKYDTGDFTSSHAGKKGVADQDLKQWLASVSGNLPDGEGKIECDGNEICTVSVRWTNRFSGEDGGGDSEDGSGTYEMVSLSSQI